MTPQDFCDKVWELLVAGAEPDASFLGRNEVELETACDEALQYFAEEMARDELRFHQLQREFQLNLTNGRGQLPADILPESLDQGWIVDSNGNPLSKVLHYMDLLNQQSRLNGYYCLQNRNLYTREKGTGRLDTTSSLTIFANYQLGLASVGLLPSTLENDALERVVTYIRSHQGGAPPTT